MWQFFKSKLFFNFTSYGIEGKILQDFIFMELNGYLNYRVTVTLPIEIQVNPQSTCMYNTALKLKKSKRQNQI